MEIPSLEKVTLLEYLHMDNPTCWRLQPVPNYKNRKLFHYRTMFLPLILPARSGGTRVNHLGVPILRNIGLQSRSVVLA